VVEEIFLQSLFCCFIFKCPHDDWSVDVRINRYEAINPSAHWESFKKKKCLKNVQLKKNQRKNCDLLLFVKKRQENFDRFYISKCLKKEETFVWEKKKLQRGMKCIFILIITRNKSKTNFFPFLLCWPNWNVFISFDRSLWLNKLKLDGIFIQM